MTWPTPDPDPRWSDVFAAITAELRDWFRRKTSRRRR